MKKYIIMMIILTVIPFLQAMNPEHYTTGAELSKFEQAKVTEDHPEKRKTPSDQPPAKKIQCRNAPKTSKKDTAIKSTTAMLNTQAAAKLIIAGLPTLPLDCLESLKKTAEDIHYGTTSFHRALTKEAVENLAALGLDPNSRDNKGQTVINALIRLGNIEGAHYLIKHYATTIDVRTPDFFVVDPLQNAILLGSGATSLCIKIIGLINKQKKPVLIKNKIQESALKLARLHNPILLPILLDNAPGNGFILDFYKLLISSNRLQEALYVACSYYEDFPLLESEISALIQKGADIDGLYLFPLFFTKDHYEPDVTLLMLAAQILSLNQIKKFIDNHATVDFKDPKGRTALMYVLRENQEQNQEDVVAAIDLLMRSGADINAANKKGKTVLMYAAMSYPTAVKFLLENGAMKTLNNVDQNGYTALDYAIESKDTTIIKALKSVGAESYDGDINEMEEEETIAQEEETED